MFERLARQMWHQTEPVHATLYFSPEAFEEAARLGHDIGSRWPSYFAWRMAPLGAAGPRGVAAACYSFSPTMIAEYMPAIWAVATPGQVLEARSRAMDRTLRVLLGGHIDMTEAAELAVRAAESIRVAHRPLAAANLELPWPREPHLTLWQAYTVLRERRLTGEETLGRAAELIEIYGASFNGPPWYEDGHGTAGFARRPATDARRPGLAAVLACRDGEPAEFGTAWPTQSPFPAGRAYDRVRVQLGGQVETRLVGALEVDELAVSPHARGQRLAARILDLLCEGATGCGLLTAPKAHDAIGSTNALAGGV
ncbi:hypothetical protein AB0G15_37640 [Streptosporangium sp. NPDC023825]|uniref:SCO6745 family protein n=1 Tax=Streptosporangium sp. NPDC023825 TaxID=3154909 RepID=UPI00344774FF